jgi:hypothetical protein
MYLENADGCTTVCACAGHERFRGSHRRVESKGGASAACTEATSGGEYMAGTQLFDGRRPLLLADLIVLLRHVRALEA